MFFEQQLLLLERVHIYWTLTMCQALLYFMLCKNHLFLCVNIYYYVICNVFKATRLKQISKMRTALHHALQPRARRWKLLGWAPAVVLVVFSVAEGLRPGLKWKRRHHDDWTAGPSALTVPARWGPKPAAAETDGPAARLHRLLGLLLRPDW